MSSEQQRDRGKLFEYAEKPKPSSPDFHGDCILDGTAYEIRGWLRDEELVVHLALPRGDKNTFPPPTLKGALHAAPPKAIVKKAKGKKGAAAAEPEDNGPPTPAWSGVIVSDDKAYSMQAFEKQGKSGVYWTLSFEESERPTNEVEWVDADDADSGGEASS